jgi:cellulose synthase/poly-beta-1,6-N-acetylglucosamine synthase-like glycosyltransferase
MVLELFVTGAVVLWLSVFGYPLALAAIPRARRRPASAEAALPPIAIVVPTLNEESLIAAKLADLAGIDYPLDRQTVLVVDGGSQDLTCDVVEREMAGKPHLQLLRLPGSAGQADQVSRALQRLPHEIVVVTDADARLEPACVRELVRELTRDPELAVAGAVVRPGTALIEERLYWWALNHIWWLEGEVLSSAMVSGACYAIRRSAVYAGCGEARALDVSLAAGAASRGLAARLSRQARATEVRVPQSAREFVAFRRRRGSGYLDAILPAPGWRTPLRWRIARAMRLWHMLVVPRLALALAVPAALLLATPDWAWPPAALAAFVAPAIVLFGVAGVVEDRHPWWRAGLAALRLIALTWLALLALAPARPIPREQEQTA